MGDIPADMAEQAEEYREKLVELAVEQDDDAMEMYLEVRRGCRSGCSSGASRGDAGMRLLPEALECLAAVLSLAAGGGAMTHQGGDAAAVGGAGARCQLRRRQGSLHAPGPQPPMHLVTVGNRCRNTNTYFSLTGRGAG